MQHIAPQCTHRCSKCFCTVNLLLFFRWNIQPENCWLIFILKCRAASVWAFFQSNLKVHLIAFGDKTNWQDLVKSLFSKKEQDKFRCLADDLWKTHNLLFMRHYNECVITLHMIFYIFRPTLRPRLLSQSDISSDSDSGQGGKPLIEKEEKVKNSSWIAFLKFQHLTSSTCTMSRVIG